MAQLIQTILSQNTSDRNSGRAWRSLRQRFRTWPQMAAAPVAAVRDSIRMGGLAGIKAPRIQHALRIVRKREGRYSLARLRRMNNAAAREYLAGIPGVGPKTAACVLMFGLGRAVMPVDTHVQRVAKRLGWAPPDAAPEEIGPLLEARLPARLIPAMHLYLVEHGRRICRARHPLCPSCPLRDKCPRCGVKPEK